MLLLLTNALAADVLWQGVEHAWHDKVHRTGRFGSWAWTDTVHHLARAGTATDTATWTTRYALLEGIETAIGSATVQVEAQEGEVVEFTQVLLLRGTDAVLNGFSVSVQEGAPSKKLGLLEIRVAGTEINDDGLVVTLAGRLMMSCKSAECGRDDRVRYEVTMHAMGLDATLHPVDDIAHVIRYDSHALADPSEGDIAGPKGLVALKALRFQAEKAVDWLRPDHVPHTFHWNAWLQDGLGSLFFAHSKAHWSNIGHEGQAEFTLSPVTVDAPGLRWQSCAWTQTAAFGNEKGGEEAYSAPADCFR